MGSWKPWGKRMIACGEETRIEAGRFASGLSRRESFEILQEIYTRAAQGWSISKVRSLKRFALRGRTHYGAERDG
jgi:hypothetical protein